MLAPYHLLNLLRFYQQVVQNLIGYWTGEVRPDRHVIIFLPSPVLVEGGGGELPVSPCDRRGLPQLGSVKLNKRRGGAKGSADTRRHARKPHA